MLAMKLVSHQNIRIHLNTIHNFKHDGSGVVVKTFMTFNLKI